MARDLDAQVAEFRTRPLDQGPYTFVAADALVLKVREGGRVVNVHALLATGVNADGHREILGLQVTSAEDGAGWLGFFRDLTARGLTGVALVTSDAHRGLVDAIGATLPGAAWQRCRTHYAANLMAATPKSSPGRGCGRCCTRSTTSPTPTSVHAQFDRVLDALTDKLPDRRRTPRRRPRRRPGVHRVPARRSGGRSGRTTRSERLNREIRRRTDVVGIFPDRARPDPARRRRPGRTARRMDRRPPLPRPRRPGPLPAPTGHRHQHHQHPRRSTIPALSA